MTSRRSLTFSRWPWIVLVLGLAVGCLPLANVGLPTRAAESGAAGKSAGADAPTERVSRAQSLLGELGYHPGKPDGLVGQRTTSAVRAFQTAVGLEPDGKIDDALVRRLAAERRKRLVRRAQEELAGLGYDPGPVDGRPGPRTRTAIVAFQETAGLPRDGQVTPALVDVLKQEDAPARTDSEMPAESPPAQADSNQAAESPPVQTEPDRAAETLSTEASTAFVRAESRILAPGDRVRINVAGDEPLTTDVQIGSDGMVWLPGIGSIRAAGLRLPKLEEQIAVKLLDRYLRRLDVRAVMQAAEERRQGQ